MVWGGVSFETWTDLVIINRGAMTADDRCVREVLEPHIVPFVQFIGDDFMLRNILAFSKPKPKPN